MFCPVARNAAYRVARHWSSPHQPVMETRELLARADRVKSTARDCAGQHTHCQRHLLASTPLPWPACPRLRWCRQGKSMAPARETPLVIQQARGVEGGVCRSRCLPSLPQPPRRNNNKTPSLHQPQSCLERQLCASASCVSALGAPATWADIQASDGGGLAAQHGRAAAHLRVWGRQLRRESCGCSLPGRGGAW